MKTLNFALITLLLLASVPAFAQVATIDTRGQDPTGPAVQTSGGTGAGSSNNAASQSLQIKLALPAFPNLTVGAPFNYQLTVTNRSAKPILLPKSLSWADVEEAGQRELVYEELVTSFAVLSENGDRGVMQGHLALYGKETNPATMMTLQPGESVRILGTATFDPAWERPPEPSTGMHLVAYLAVNSARLRPKNDQGDVYTDDERQLYRTESQQMQISFQATQ